MRLNSQAIEKKIDSDGMVLDVHSIFYTIQGEGPFCGHPAVFIRLAGCNLQCPGCDTDYTTNRKQLAVSEIIREVQDHLVIHRPIVVITGGEPFRQNISPLTRELIDLGYQVQIETNGTLPPSKDFPYSATIVCSPKAGKINPYLADRVDAYKYVMEASSVNENDGLPVHALNHSAEPQVARPTMAYGKKKIYLQPMDQGPTAFRENANNLHAVKESCLKFGHILQLQVHKIIGVE